MTNHCLARRRACRRLAVLSTVVPLVALASALAIAKDDVYVRSGVWGEITVRPFGRLALTNG